MQIQQTAIPGTEPEPEEAEGSDLRQDLGVTPSSHGEMTTVIHGVPAAAVTPPLPQTALALKTPEWGVGEGWLAEYERMALRVAGATTLPEGLTKNADQRTVAKNVLTIALAGRELGIGFMEATRQIDIINGATALRAELKMAMAKRAGMIVDSISFQIVGEGQTVVGCDITAHRKDTGESATASFTEADKKRAKLGASARSAWDSYPEDMYYARAASRLVRRLMPDARGASFYSVEELTEDVTENV